MKSLPFFAVLAASMGLASCSANDQDEPTTIDSNVPSETAPGVGPVAQSLFTPPFEFRNRDTPNPEASCSFESHDPAERPSGLQSANRDSNVIFLQKPKGPLWSHAETDRALAELTPQDLIVAARYQKPDLWIRAKKPLVTLETSADKLTCY